jgi:hypothetical protein
MQDWHIAIIRSDSRTIEDRLYLTAEGSQTLNLPLALCKTSSLLERMARKLEVNVDIIPVTITIHYDPVVADVEKQTLAKIKADIDKELGIT